MTADRARDAALCLGARLGVEPVSFDRALIEQMTRLREEKRVQETAIHEADLAGGTDPGTWHTLPKIREPRRRRRRATTSPCK